MSIWDDSAIHLINELEVNEHEAGLADMVAINQTVQPGVTECSVPRGPNLSWLLPILGC